jgi:DnaJ family protein C protein 13
VIAALLTYLPKQQSAALAASSATLSREEARLVILALHCLQRLSSSPFAATQIVGSSGGSGKVFAALLSGHDHVATEAARLLYRLFSPAAGRVGASPKPLHSSGSGSSPGGSPMSTGGAMEDVASARTTKSVCFISDARCGSLIAPLKPPRQRPQQLKLKEREKIQKLIASPLLSGAIIEVVAAVACKPGSRTTELSTREALLVEVASVGRPLFSLFNHPAKQISDVAALVMQAVAEGGATAAAPMREAALAEGAVLHHLLSALGPASAPRTQLSRHVVALWADAHEPTLKILRRIFPVGLMQFLDEPKKKVAPMAVRRLGPPDRRAMLGSTTTSTASTSRAGVVSNTSNITNNTRPLSGAGAGGSSMTSGGGHLLAPATSSLLTIGDVGGDVGGASRERSGATTSNQQQQKQPQLSVVPPSSVPERLLSGGYRSNASTPQLRGNWDAFWAAAEKDHCHAALVWNERTRSELREALQAEENALRLGRQRVADAQGSVSPAWNSAEFSVVYPSLSSYLTIGGVHVKLLLDAAASSSSSSVGSAAGAGSADKLKSLVNPREFFTAAHLHFLRRGDSGLFASSSSSRGGSNSSGTTTSGNGSSCSARDTWNGIDASAERELCVRAMAAAYAVHAVEIGPFEGMQHIVDLLDSTPSKSLRQWLLCLLHALVCPERTAQKIASSSSSSILENGGEEEEEEKEKAKYAFVSRVEDAASPTTSKQREKAAVEVAQANAAALVAAGGVEILVDLVSTAHEASERPAAALQTGLIASTSHAEAVKVWFYLPLTAGALPSGGAAGAVMAYFEENKTGPISKAEIRQLFAKNVISFETVFWAPGMHEAAALGAIRELRWWVSSGIGHLTPFQVAEISLRVLTGLATLRPAVDARREALIPLPAAHRQMASSRCLPHLAQVVLTGEPSLVAAASMLLLKLVEHNEDAMSSLYHSGVFFFLLSYCGSNLVEVSRLFKASHLRQRFLGAAEAGPGLPLSKKSFLGSLLPESLLYSLESYGPVAFANALAGDADTPEIIWTHRMRGQRLVPQMIRHIGDLPRRLAECCSSVYDYTPCPPVGYPELTQEMFCHRYYLRHLCDDVKFPNWKLVDHVQFLQALLEAWRTELTRRPLGLTAAEAARVLGLDVNAPEGLTEDAMKAAYRKLARQYHPDRNPEGRDKFEAVQKAFEALSQAGADGGGNGGGPQPWRILLLLRAQCILYKRYASVLQQYKYAGFPLLLAAIEAPATSTETDTPHFLSDEVAPRLSAATELCWLICAASKLNGEELARSGGVHLMGELLTRCISIMPADVSPTDPAAVLATQALRAFACMSAFGVARADIEKREQVVEDVLRACALQRAPSATDAALQCAIQMCRSPVLQERLLQRGAIGYLIPLMLKYDATAVENTSKTAAAPGAALSSPSENVGSTSTAVSSNSTTTAGPEIFDPDQESARGPEFLGLGVTWTNMQAARNHHAALAVRALAVLGGYPGCKPPTSPCLAAQKALAGLLTQALASRLVDPDSHSLLSDLNSSVSSPHVVWNPKMREELATAAEEHRRMPGAEAIATAAQYSYASLRGELIVAGVYVRVYIEQPSFALKDSVAFCKGLVTKIHALQQERQTITTSDASGRTAANFNGEEEESLEQRRRRHLSQCLTALASVLDVQPRLMGVLATKPALEPLLGCIAPVCELGHFGPLWPKYSLPTTTNTTLAMFSPSVLPRDRWAAVAAVDGAENLEEELISACDAASAALTILLKLTAHAGCVEAMSNERCLIQAYWVAHRPPRPEDQMRALKLLHALSSTAAAAWAAAAHAGVFFLAEVLLPVNLEADDASRSAQEAAREGAAAVLARLAAHPLHGPRVVLWLSKLLPPGLVASIQDGPPRTAVLALAEPSETPERIWTRGMQRAAAEEISHLASAARTAQAGTNTSLDWTPGDSYSMKYEGLRDEMFVGGVYVCLFLKSPGYPLKNPQAFLEGLLERYTKTIAAEASSAPPVESIDVDAAVLLSAAAVAAIHHHPLLAEHGVALGYASKLVRALASRVPSSSSSGGAGIQIDTILPADDVSGSALRLLHALASAPSAGEALARSSPPSVPVLVAAMQWGGAAAVLAVETLKRGLAAGNRSRDLLVGAALSANLLDLLFSRLDWRSSSGDKAAAVGDEASDEAVQRVLFVDVINLLGLEGVYAPQVRAVLDNSEVWAAYKGQKHDLFLPSGGSSAVHGVAGLLRGPETARFALPAPPPAVAVAAAESVVIIAPEEPLPEEVSAVVLEREEVKEAVNEASVPDSEETPDLVAVEEKKAEEAVVVATEEKEEMDIEEEKEPFVPPPQLPSPQPPAPLPQAPAPIVQQPSVETVAAPPPLDIAPEEATTPRKEQTTPAAVATQSPLRTQQQELSPTKAFTDPLSALGDGGNNDDSD